MEKLLFIPSLSMFNDDWDLFLKFLENEGYPPFHFDGTLDLYGKKIPPNLISVGHDLDLFGEIDSPESPYSIGDLERVGGDLSISNTNISSLGKLKYVGGDLYAVNVPNLNMSKVDIRKQVWIVGRIIM